MKSGLTSFQVNIVLIILALITIYPFSFLLLNSVGLKVGAGHLDITAYIEVLQERLFLAALYNTIAMALSITILSLAIGGSLAWILLKTDLRNKKTFEFLIFLTYMTPSYILAVAMIEILGPMGILADFLRNTFNYSEMPIKIYSLFGVVLVMTIHLYPLAYMGISGALKGCERSLEEAALLDGTGPISAFLKIILPAITPSIFSIGLFIFAHSISCFGVAALLALPARKYILPTYIYTSLSGLKLQKATAMSILLALITGSLYFLQKHVTNEKFKIIPNDNYGETKVKLGFHKVWMRFGFYFFFTLTIVLPLTIVLIVSFLKAWGVQWVPGNFTIDNYRQIFSNDLRVVKAIFNSIIFGAVAATLASIIGSFAIYLGVRAGGYKGKIIDYFLSWPMAVPEVVLAVAAILTWINPPIKLYGTPWIIIITYIVASLPFVIRNVKGLIDSIDPELEEVAWTNGASTWSGFRKIVVPLIGSGLKSGWICSFLFALHEIPISILLYAPGTETVGVILYSLRSDTGGLEMISALAVVILLVIIGGRAAIQKLWSEKFNL